ncbi:MAG: hypothetical protein KKH29_04880, partial [Candidatus Omnitrophica bacterium]|nr:hypothetical protein [Candidatus Omnitrophota bacterium]
MGRTAGENLLIVMFTGIFGVLLILILVHNIQGKKEIAKQKAIKKIFPLSDVYEKFERYLHSDYRIMHMEREVNGWRITRECEESILKWDLRQMERTDKILKENYGEQIVIMKFRNAGWTELTEVKDSIIITENFVPAHVVFKVSYDDTYLRELLEDKDKKKCDGGKSTTLTQERQNNEEVKRWEHLVYSLIAIEIIFALVTSVLFHPAFSILLMSGFVSFLAVKWIKWLENDNTGDKEVKKSLKDSAEAAKIRQQLAEFRRKFQMSIKRNLTGKDKKKVDPMQKALRIAEVKYKSEELFNKGGLEEELAEAIGAIISGEKDVLKIRAHSPAAAEEIIAILQGFKDDEDYSKLKLAYFKKFTQQSALTGESIIFFYSLIKVLEKFQEQFLSKENTKEEELELKEEISYFKELNQRLKEFADADLRKFSRIKRSGWHRVRKRSGWRRNDSILEEIEIQDKTTEQIETILIETLSLSRIDIETSSFANTAKQADLEEREELLKKITLELGLDKLKNPSQVWTEIYRRCLVPLDENSQQKALQKLAGVKALEEFGKLGASEISTLLSYMTRKFNLDSKGSEALKGASTPVEMGGIPGVKIETNDESSLEKGKEIYDDFNKNLNAKINKELEDKKMRREKADEVEKEIMNKIKEALKGSGIVKLGEINGEKEELENSEERLRYLLGKRIFSLIKIDKNEGRWTLKIKGQGGKGIRRAIWSRLLWSLRNENLKRILGVSLIIGIGGAWVVSPVVAQEAKNPQDNSGDMNNDFLKTYNGQAVGFDTSALTDNQSARVGIWDEVSNKLIYENNFTGLSPPAYTTTSTPTPTPIITPKPNSQLTYQQGEDMAAQAQQPTQFQNTSAFNVSNTSITPSTYKSTLTAKASSLILTSETGSLTSLNIFAPPILPVGSKVVFNESNGNIQGIYTANGTYTATVNLSDTEFTVSSSNTSVISPLHDAPNQSW